MTAASDSAAGSRDDLVRQGQPAILVRILGWLTLAMLAAYLVNSWLTYVRGWPGTAAALEGGSATGFVQIAIYAVLALGAITFVMRTPETTLRMDGDRVSRFNAWLVRAAFWSVLLVGIADAAISFMRVENLLDVYVGPQMATDIGRPQYRGPYIHLPLIGVGMLLALVTRTLGFTWLALLVVVAELMIVLARFIFSYEQAFMGDLVRFWYAALFLFASAYTLIDEGHVRVDVLYAGMKDTTKGMVNAVGSILLGIIFCWVILFVGMGNRSAIIISPLVNFEVSQSGFGMYVKYLMAGFLGIFAITMMIQFVSYLFEAVADWRGEPGAREISAPSAH
ncbi:MAG: TRAP transporter small permease subunit [Geminicoccaceae bacterium]|nr:TRAP transporter small permease subunit [Geminicoccaceae bacterium]